jgi:hypothetical protein
LLGGPKEDLVYLAGHFDASAALAADQQTTVSSSELLAPTVNLTNSLVFSTGCHAGYSTVDADGVVGLTQPDWAQVLARKGATLVAGTGFQYGDDELIEYSERIYAEFAHQLRVGNGPVSVGQALVKSKLAYLTATLPKGMHQKALLTASVFGLPMFSVNVNGTRDLTGNTPEDIVTSTSNALGVTTANVHLDNTQFDPQAETGPNGTTYYSGHDGTASNPGEPALPRFIGDAGVTGKVLRGVGFRGGVFDDQSPVKPFTGAPGTEFGGAQSPFASTTFYPARMWSANYFGELGSGSTNLVVTPAQHRVVNVGDTDAIRRLFSALDLQLFYADENDATAAFATAPGVSDVTASISGSIVTFAARVHGTAATSNDVKTAWLTYTFGDNVGCSCWQSIELTRSDTDDSIWTKTLDISGFDQTKLRFIVQAVNVAALVGIDDNDGAYHSLASAAAGTPEATTMTLGAHPGSAVYGSDVNVKATLRKGLIGLSGKTVVFRIGSAFATDVTDANGLAEATFPVLTTPGDMQLVASYGGEVETATSSAEDPFTVNKLGTSLTLSLGAGTVLGDPSGISSTLTAGGDPLSGRTIFFVLKGTGTGTIGNGFTKSVTTDTNGVGVLGSTPSLPFGTYEIKAYFNGAIPLNPWAAPADQQTLTLTDPVYNAATPVSNSLTIQRRPQTITFGTVPTEKKLGNPDFAVTATASTGLPVTFSSTSPTVCTVTSTGTVHLVNIGQCVVKASQAGNSLYVPVDATVAIKVIWPFTGFFAPVDNSPIVNVAKAGSTIPVKFSLGGNRGLAIFSGGDPRVIKLSSCGTGAIDEIETVSTTNNGLVYDAASGQYQYNWKTVKGLTGCYRLDVVLADVTTYSAFFQFK